MHLNKSHIPQDVKNYKLQLQNHELSELLTNYNHEEYVGNHEDAADYATYLGPSEVRATSGQHLGGHYWSERSACDQRSALRWPLF
jgi:hypothetical protein